MDNSLSGNALTIWARSPPVPGLEDVTVNPVESNVVLHPPTDNALSSVLDQAPQLSAPTGQVPSSKPNLPKAVAKVGPLGEQDRSARDMGKENGNLVDRLPPPNGQPEQPPDFWIGYNKAADFEDREFVKAAGGNLDTLLIFAGLFSGINTTFIIESLKTVQPDQMGKTNDLILSMILVFQNATVPNGVAQKAEFIPSTRSVRSTAMFFASLSCSLAAAFGAVLGKQWLTYYEREGRLKPPRDRGRERQKKYDGRIKWHLEGVTETLPTILQISLFLFLAALVEFLWPINKTCEKVVLGFGVVLACFYIITTTAAIIYPLSPFQTRLSVTIRKISTSIRTIFLASLPRIKDTIHNLIGHTLKELTDGLGMCMPIFGGLYPVPLYRKVYQILVFPALWPPYLLWRLAVFILRSMLRFSQGLPSSFSSYLHSQTYPATMHVTNAMLDLKCLMFFAERASTSEDLKQLFAGANALPTGLDLPAHHPFFSSLGETLLKLVIKPTGSRWSASSSLSANEFQHLLRPLHLLYSTWKHLDDPESNLHSSPYFDHYAVLIWRKLWDVFFLNPQDTISASLVADIFDLPILLRSGRDGFDTSSAAIQNILILLILENPDTLYIRLLAISLDSGTIPERLPGVDIVKLTQVLLPKLQETVDMRCARQRVWAEVLPDHLGETPLDLLFSKYLARACSAYCYAEGVLGKLNWAERERLRRFSTPTHLSCLRAVFKLIHRNPESFLWPQTFENDGVPSLLLHILHQLPDDAEIWGLACLCFVSLWHKHHLLHSIAEFQTPTQYLSPDSVELIARRLWFIKNIKAEHLHGIEGRYISQTMVHVAEYFEKASSLKLLKRGMESRIAKYKKRGYCHNQVGQGVLQGLYERMDKLVFT